MFLDGQEFFRDLLWEEIRKGATTPEQVLSALRRTLDKMVHTDLVFGKDASKNKALRGEILSSIKADRQAALDFAQNCLENCPKNNTKDQNTPRHNEKSRRVNRSRTSGPKMEDTMVAPDAPTIVGEDRTDQEQAGLNPGEHLMNLKGRDYLPASVRIAWFRQKFPIEKGWSVRTQIVEGGREAKYAIYRADIIDPNGVVVQTATKMEDIQGFGDYLEKAETGAISRAVTFCGFGTLQAQELDERTDRLHDTPTARKSGHLIQSLNPPQKQGAERLAPTLNVRVETEPPAATNVPTSSLRIEGLPNQTTCVVDGCGKELGKGRLGWCKTKNLPPHCPTCALPVSE